MKAGFRKVAGVVFRFCSRIAFVAAVLPALYLIEPFLRIRIGLMHTQRIGHLGGNTDMLFRKLRLNGMPSRTVYYLFGWDPANRQLFKMFLRLKVKGVNLRESLWGTRLVSSWRPILAHTRFWLPNRLKGTEYREFASTTPVISFTDEEERQGRAGLAAMGIGESDWFVCFHARDGTYLRAWRPQYKDYWDSTNNDILNCNVENFLKAAEYVTSRGGFAVRMGAVVEAPLPDTGNPRIIDYATRYRSDFMDVYLCARCLFFLGTCSGLTHIPVIFGRPIIYASHMAFDHPPPRRSDLTIPRLLTTRDRTRIVDFQEAADRGYRTWNERGEITHGGGRNTDLFNWIENGADDIRDVCRDMFDLLDGVAPPEAARRVQAEHARRYFSRLPDYQLGGDIGPSFALKYKHLIIPEETPVKAAS